MEMIVQLTLVLVLAHVGTSTAGGQEVSAGQLGWLLQGCRPNKAAPVTHSAVLKRHHMHNQWLKEAGAASDVGSEKFPC